MKRIILLIGILALVIGAECAIPFSKIVGKEFTSFKNIYAMYDVTNDFDIGFKDHFDQRIYSNDTSGGLWLSLGGSSFSFDFEIINDTTIYITSIICGCDTPIGNSIFNVVAADYDYEYSIPVNSNAYLRNKNELHFDFSPQTRQALNKTNILKENYLNDVLYLFRIESDEDY